MGWGNDKKQLMLLICCSLGWVILFSTMIAYPYVEVKCETGSSMYQSKHCFSVASCIVEFLV